MTQPQAAVAAADLKMQHLHGREMRKMGQVVEFPLRLPEADVFEHEDVARLYAEWRRAMRPGDLPQLRDFAPRRLGRWMAWSGVVETPAESLEALADGAIVRWRLAGSALCRLAGRELTRQEVFHGWPRFERATLGRLLGQTLFRRQAFVARMQLGEGGLLQARLEMLALPLHDVARGRNVGLLVLRPDFPVQAAVPATLDSARLLSLRTLKGGIGLPVAGRSREDGDGGMTALTARVLPLFGDAPARA